MFVHNLKVAVRNLMKYRLQTVISVLSIAIGIVTLAIAHAVLARTTVPSIYSRPYYDRTYTLWLAPANSYVHGTNEGAALPVTDDILRALKRDGGLKSAEQMAVPNFMIMGDRMEFFLNDTTARMWQWNYTPIDPGYLHLVGIRSAITGRVIDRLKAGEAVISRQMASRIFGKDCPVGAVTREPIAECPMPITIVDVYDDLSIYDLPLDDQFMYISLGEPGGDLDGRIATGDVFYTETVLVVLKEGYTTQQLTDEANARLKPFGLVATLKKTDVTEDVRTVITTQTLVHLIGALILIAALIGFLRMQVQLFRMPRREMALRITHGAKRRHLFALLFTEVAIVVAMAMATAMLMGIGVEQMVASHFADWTGSLPPFPLHRLALYSLGIGAMLLLLCGGIIWIAAARTCRSATGLAAHMRHSRSHLFRHLMLGIQTAISTVFVCSTLTITQWTDSMKAYCNMPDDLTTYKNCLWLDAGDVREENRADFLSETARLPSLKAMIPFDISYWLVGDIQDNPEVEAAFNGHTHQPFCHAADTALVAFHHLRVKWLNKEAIAGPCVLLNDSIYQKLHRLGAVRTNTLTFYRRGSIPILLPIAGTISQMPYRHEPVSILIDADMARDNAAFVLVPKEGKYEALLHEAESMVQRREPSAVRKMVYNFHSMHPQVSMAESLLVVGRVLGAVSIVICAMGIYSAIALDTRSRRKEVAIRKVCGAKSGDIYRLFGRVYLLIVALALLVALPVAVLFHRFMFPTKNTRFIIATGADVSPLMPCLIGALIIIALIVAIVARNIHSIMRTNPAEIIAKE